jgi:(+)-trans-carveol dehydrogenase
MSGLLAGRVALVTGAARGQGRSHAIRLAEEGADIVAIDICADIPNLTYAMADPDDLAETVREVEKRSRRAIAVEADVRDATRLRAEVGEAVTQLGRLDIVAANAGIATTGAAHEVDPALWHATIGVNLTGVWNTCSAAIPHLIRGQRGGSIVITSSALGLRGMQNATAYSAAKHGVVGVMRTLARELGPHRIRVNTIHPTQVDTPMIMREATYKVFVPELENPTREDFAARSQGMHELPVPWVDPIDISEALLFLVSDPGRYITGVALPVDAGNVMR